MRNLVLVLLLVAVAGGGLYLLLGGSDEGGGGGGVVSEGGDDPDVRGGPGLEGTGAGLGQPIAAEGLATGRGAISGFVLRGGAPVQARVELRQVMPIGEEGMLGALTGGGTRIFDIMLGAGSDGRAAATSSTDGKVRFNFTELPAGIYQLRATDEDRRTATTSVALPADGARISQDVHLPEGDQALDGRITFADGKAFRGVGVLSPSGGRRMMSFFGPVVGTPIATDAEGNYSLRGLLPGQYTVTALVAGSLRVSSSPFAVPHEGIHELKIPAGTNKASGTVVDAETEEPIAGARVLAGGGEPGEGLFMISSTTADEKGQFEIAIPGGGEGGVLATHPGYGVGMHELRGGGEGLSIRLTRTGAIQGRVLGPDGEPVGAGVSVLSMGGGRGFMPSFGTALTNDKGEYLLDEVPAGPARISARGMGYVSSAGTSSQVTVNVVSGETSEHDIAVVHGGTIEGTVYAPDGKPIAGAVVGAQSERGDRNLMQAFMMMGAGLGVPVNSVVSGADGRYRLESVEAAIPLRLTAMAALQAQYSSDELQVEAEQTLAHDIHFAEARWLDLTVVGDGGAPVPGAMVMVASQGGTGRGWMPIVMQPFVTNAEGTVRVGPLPEGVVALQVKAAGHVDQGDWQEIEASGEGKGSFEHRLELVPGRLLAGTVRGPAGVDVTGTRVAARRESSGVGRWYHGDRRLGAAGTFRFDDLPEGRFRVSARLDYEGRRFKADREFEPDQENIELVLEEVVGGDGNLVIEIVDAAGEPIPSGRINVSIQSGNGSSSSGTGFSQGRFFFELGEREADSVTIQVSDMGPKYGAASVGPLPPPADGQIRIIVEDAVTISGTALGPDGAAVKGLELRAVLATEGGREHATTRTDKEGNFTFKGLGKNRYRIESEPRGALLAPDPAIEVVGGTQQVRFEMRQGVSARITVLGGDGKPLNGLYVNAEPVHPDKDVEWREKWQWQRKYQRSAQTDGKGLAVLEGIDPQFKFTLQIQANPSRGVRSKTIDPWEPGDTEVRLEASYTIKGRVELASPNAAYGGGTVFWRPAGQKDKGWTGTNVDAQRKFQIDGLPAGNIELHFRPEHSLGTFHQENDNEANLVVAKAGDVGVVVPARLGSTVLLEVPDGARLKEYTQIQIRYVSEGRSGTSSVHAQEGKPIVLSQLVESMEYTALAMGLPGGNYMTATFTHNSGTVRLNVRKGRVIAGAATFEGGESAGQVSIWMRREEGSVSQWVQSDAEGRFRFEGLPEGTWSLQASGRKGEQRFEGSVDVQAGDESISIVLKPR